MFYQVSWQIYFIAFSVVAGLYYLVVLFLFFRKSITHALKRKLIDPRENRQTSGSMTTEKSESYDDYATYQSLRDEITAFLESSGVDSFKSDILFSLVSIIKKYPPLEDNRFVDALNKEIRRLYMQKYIDGITENELSALWQV